MSDKRIKVACRVRPRMEKFGERYEVEICKKTDEITLVLQQPVEEHEKPKPTVFSFDHVFDSNDTQRDIYEEAALDIIDGCLDGCNGTIFAYGQTGSGKTFTVLGEVAEQSESLVTPNSGLFLRSLCDLFTYKERSRRTLNVTIKLSILEIYNEELRDLLNKKNKIQVRAIGDDVQLPNLQTVEVETLQDVYKYFNIAQGQRSVSKTDMNDVSSRSHAVFIVDILQAPKDANPLMEMKGNAKGDENIRKSRLVICDLAGSERVKRSGVEGKALLEAQAINKSLACLGNVVNGLYMESKHIPYRDSKLTHLLRSSFIDSASKVLLITNLSPSGGSFQESLSSLRFADRVKGLKAGAVHMIDPAAEQEYLSKLRLAEEICSDLRICGAQHDFTAQRPRERPELAVLASSARVSKVVEEYKRDMQKRSEEKKRNEEDELKRMVKEETDAVVEAWRKKTQDMESNLRNAVSENKNLQQDLGSCTETKQKEVDFRMNEAKKKKKERRNAEDKTKRAKDELEVTKSKEQESIQGVQDEEAKYMASMGADETDWHREVEATEKMGEDNRKISSVMETANKFQDSVDRYLSARNGNFATETRVAGMGYEAQFYEIQDLVNEVLDRVLAAVVDPANRRATATEDSDEEDRMDYDPKIRAAPTNTAIQNKRAQVVFARDGVDGVTGQSATANYDEEDADRQYLMGIYDAQNLVKDIVRYLQSGTVLIKHGRNGKPHQRKFQISEDAKLLYWFDGDKEKQKKSHITLKEVTGITMGQYSKVFRRTHSNDSMKADFYNSFTLTIRGGKRTVDVVAETVSEFEAWLIGLSHLLNIEPAWGQPLAMNHEQRFQELTARERDLCAQHHITPTLFLKLKEIVLQRRDEVKDSIALFSGNMQNVYKHVGGIHPPELAKNGALWMTKGELRYLANVDIFRTCVIWYLLNLNNLIFDRDFKPATPHPKYVN